jgi:hypothetical protein
MGPSESPLDPSSPARFYVWLAAFTATVVGFFELGRRFADYRIPQGPPGGWELPLPEVAFYLWYLVFGVVASACLTAALVRSRTLHDLEERLLVVARQRWFFPVVALVLLAEILAAKDFVLHGAPVSDDESAYVFIARTLAELRVKNPVPEDAEYFRSTFVLIRDSGWYGKYPVGHPAVLALGEVVGLRLLVCPLLAVATAWATHRVGRRLFGPGAAALAVLLLVVSPQFVLTSATEHSQNTSTLAMMLAIEGFVRVRAARPLATRWALGCGAAVGFGLLARPLPGALFALALAVYALGGGLCRPLGERVRATLLGAVPVVACGLVLLAVNRAQTGSAWSSGYQVLHGGSGGVFAPDQPAAMVSSLAAGFVRQWFWAFGWPLSFAFLPFAWRGRRSGATVLWLFVGAGYAYRLISPKVFVGTTGPIYLAEMVPLLAILTGGGMVRARAYLARFGARPRRAVGAVAVSFSVVAACMFLPVAFDTLRRASAARRFVPDELARLGVARALVFTNQLSPPWTGDTWAMAPPPPSPSLDDRILYVRDIGTEDDLRAFAARRFPDRSAWRFGFVGRDRVLVPLRSGPGPSTETRRGRR